jgi:hypothetical protein
MKKNKKRTALSKHHIIPRSRGGSSLDDNIALVSIREHQEYHTLFSNRTPQEIVQYLNTTFWRSNYYIEMEEVRKYGQNRRNY